MEPDSHLSKKTRTSRQRTATGDSRKKISVNKACIPCRKRKAKCDGKSPCARCQKTSTECISDPVPGSNAKARDSPPPERPQTMEAPTNTRLETLRSRGKRKMNTPTPLSDESDLSLPSQSDEDDSYVDTNAAPAVTKTDTKNTPVQTAEEEGRSVAISMTGQALYISTPSPDVPMDTVDRNALRTDLIQTYFQHIHPYFPILHETSFQHLLSQQKTSLVLLYAIYAVASRWHPATEKLSSMPGLDYYQRSLVMLDQALDTPRLTTLQALLLLMKYHEYIRRPGYIWRTEFYLEMVARLCRDLRQDASELTKRVIWMAYMISVLHGIEHGKPSTIEPPDTHPKTLDVERQDKAITYFHSMTQIMTTLASVMQFVQQKDAANDMETVNMHGNKLVSLEKQISAEHVEPQNEYAYYTVAFLRLALAFAFIVLFRPSADKHEKSRDMIFSAAMNITDTVSALTKRGSMLYLTSCPRGIPQIMHYLAAAATIQKQYKTLRNDKGARATQAYNNTIRMFEILIKMTPAIELDTDTKPALPALDGRSFRAPPPPIPQQPQLTLKSHHNRHHHVQGLPTSVPSQFPPQYNPLGAGGPFQAPVAPGPPLPSHPFLAYPHYSHHPQGHILSQHPPPHSVPQPHMLRSGSVPQTPSPASFEDFRPSFSKELLTASHMVTNPVPLPNSFSNLAVSTHQYSQMMMPTQAQLPSVPVNMPQHYVTQTPTPWNIPPLPNSSYANLEPDGASMPAFMQDGMAQLDTSNASMMGLLMDAENGTWDPMLTNPPI